MGKLNIKAKAKKVVAKLKNTQKLTVPMKAKTIKAESQQVLLTPKTKVKLGNSKIKSNNTGKQILKTTIHQKQSPYSNEHDDDEGDANDDTNDEKRPLKNDKIIKSKKDKIRQKHKNLMNKFELIKKQAIEEKQRKKREKTAIVGDMKPLKDALPSMDELFVLSKKSTDIKTGVKEFDSTPKKLNVKQKFKEKRNKLIRQVKSYEALLKDADFKKNPREAIAFHIKYTHGLIDE